MSSQQNLGSSQTLPAIGEQQVEEFLRGNPDFFERHTNLLASLRIPHPSGPAISLVERQVKVLREQNRAYKRKLMELVQVGRDNDKVNRNLHALTVVLLQSATLAQVLDALLDSLTHGFKATDVAVRLAGFPRGLELPPQVELLDAGGVPPDAFQSFMQAARPICGRLKAEQLEYLFADKASQIDSAALVPLGADCRLGMLAIGSDDSNRFHPGMDTLFLRNLGEIASAALEPYRDSREGKDS
jgi:hypothetical protein